MENVSPEQKPPADSQLNRPPIPLSSPKKPSSLWGTEGYLPREVVRAFVFWCVTLSIFISAVALLFGIWGLADGWIIGRIVATCLVIGSAMVTFAIWNVLFGKRS